MTDDLGKSQPQPSILLTICNVKCRYCCKSPKLPGANFLAVKNPTDDRRSMWPNHVTEVASELSLVAFHNEPPPAFRAPPKSCDAHFHIFGPAERYPYGSATTENLRYAPPLAPLPDYLELAKLLRVRPAQRLWPRQCLHARCHARDRGPLLIKANGPSSRSSVCRTVIDAAVGAATEGKSDYGWN